ncbi:MAG: response regulator transcription factor [Leptolyngbya sp. SIO1D8]|nr:response regulator transcription factor [Leptolyngbya sp. SIO1D8]
MYRILIAEDEPRIASFMVKGLKRSGFATKVVNSGEAALKIILAEEFDLLLLDLGLPGIEGKEVLTELRLQDFKLPVIVVTARSLDTKDEVVIGTLASGVIYKPFLMRVLLSKIQSLLENSEEDS